MFVSTNKSDARRRPRRRVATGLDEAGDGSEIAATPPPSIRRRGAYSTLRRCGDWCAGPPVPGPGPAGRPRPGHLVRQACPPAAPTATRRSAHGNSTHDFVVPHWSSHQRAPARPSSLRLDGGVRKAGTALGPPNPPARSHPEAWDSPLGYRRAQGGGSIKRGCIEKVWWLHLTYSYNCFIEES